MSLDLSIFQDAAQYLRMSEEKKMEIMAKQIALAKQIGGPKPVWVPTPEDPDMGYTRGLWSETKAGMAQLVRDDNGETYAVKEVKNGLLRAISNKNNRKMSWNATLPSTTSAKTWPT